MIVLAADLLLISTILLVLGIGMAKGKVFFANAKPVYSLLMLSIVLPFPFYVVFSLNLSGFLAAASIIVLFLFMVIVLYPIVRMPETFAAFNAGREDAARVMQSVLETHGIPFDGSAPHPGAPVVLRPGFPFRPERGWRFSIEGSEAHILVGGLFSSSVALVGLVGCRGMPGLEAALADFKASLRARKPGGTPPDAITLIIAGSFLFFFACAFGAFHLFA